MKNILKALAFILVLPIAFIGCTEEDVLKSTYDYVPDSSLLPSTSVTIGEVTGSSVQCTGSITFGTDKSYIEKGFVCATDVNFTKGVVSKGVKGSNFSSELFGLKELTEYYVRSYVITKDGVVYSAIKIFSTPVFENPLIDFVGVYLMSDYKYADETLDAAYNVEFLEIEGNARQLKLKNFWDGGTEIIVNFNMVNKSVSIDNNQIIYVSNTYGDTKALPFDGSAVSNTPLLGTIGANGVITFNSWSAQVTAGSFGLYKRSTLTPTKNK